MLRTLPCFPFFAENIAAVDSALENAELLLEILKAAEKDTADATATVAKFKAVSDDLHAKYDAMYKTYLEICGVAAEYEIVSNKEESAEFYTIVPAYTSAKTYMDEVFGRNVVEEEKEVTKYTCDDGSIVAVTYGGKNGDDAAAYRTFLLNYNAFAVTVEYNGASIKLDAYSYYVIKH